ncbi:hypothetical protein BC629DRAFT_1598231 [Irpex lacteus]|nr:hypothetical protein BC629DRAFT_1598231 [Irpex lacteus]
MSSIHLYEQGHNRCWRTTLHGICKGYNVPFVENASCADTSLQSRLHILAVDLPRPANPTSNSLSLALGNPPTLSVMKTGTTNPILTHEFPYVETEPASLIEDTNLPEHPSYERLGGAIVDLPPVDELDHLSTTADVGHEDSDMTNSSSSLPSLISISTGSTLASSHEPSTPPEPLEDPHNVPHTVPHLLHHHLQLRRYFCHVLEYAALIALEKGLNLYLEHL